MTPLKRMKNAFEKTLEGAAEFASAMCDFVSEAINAFSLNEEEYLAYIQALQSAPELVRRAKYSKKARVRKKNHNRIMREYGRRM